MTEAIKPIKIKKAKYTLRHGKVTVHIVFLTQPKGGGAIEEEEFNSDEIKRHEAPLQSYIDALQALVPDVVDICELPDDYGEGVTVRGVTFTYTKGVMSATITALKKLQKSHAPVVINTPNKPTEPYSKGADEANCLDMDTAERLYVLIREAIRYVRGERAPVPEPEQKELFGETKDAGETPILQVVAEDAEDEAEAEDTE